MAGVDGDETVEYSRQEQREGLPIKCLSVKSKGLISNVLPNIRQFGVELKLNETELDYYMKCQNPVHQMLDRVRDKEYVPDLIYILQGFGIPGENKVYRSIGMADYFIRNMS